jgi:hypothetical protein
MTRCPHCGEKLPEPARRTVLCRHFRGLLTSWQDLFQQAADFGTTVGPDRLITISHSEDDNEGVVTVWYWSA